MKKSVIELRREAGRNKKIPSKYEEVILTALSFYPELKNTNIHFKLTQKHPVPYGTAPSFGSLFRSAENRIYNIIILEEAKGFDRWALFKNLTKEKQVAVLAHELSHVSQYNTCSVKELLLTMLKYPLPWFKRKLERSADLGAIEHGFGVGLYKHAIYLRSIPGYVKRRPAINRYYLKPEEIINILRRRKKSVA